LVLNRRMNAVVMTAAMEKGIILISEFIDRKLYNLNYLSKY